jgi:ADP-ribose pyrophosphatase
VTKKNLQKPNKKIIFRTEWFNIEEETYQGFDALQDKPFYRINAPDGVIILATTAENKILLVKQFRPALNAYTIEFPSGGILTGEKPEDAAKRELLEETGYLCQEILPLLEGHVMLSRFSSKDYAFWGHKAKIEINQKKDKSIELLLWSPEELIQAILEGKFNHFAMISLLLLIQLKYHTFDPI